MMKLQQVERRRDSKIDVAKGVLILLVVLGHTLELSALHPTNELAGGWFSHPQEWLLTWLYLFHMPLFIALVGMTANLHKLGSRIVQAATLAVVMQLVYVVPLTIHSGEMPVGVFTPFWMLWFLLGMVWWLALLPLVERYPRSVLALSVVAAALVGMVPGDGVTLAYARAIVFFPFFVAGHLYGKGVLNWTRGARFGLRLAGFALTVLLASGILASHMNGLWLFGRGTFAEMGGNSLVDASIRLGLTAASAVACVGVLLALPATSRLFELPGRRSLAVFVFHGAFLIAGGSSLAALSGRLSGWWMTLISIILAAAIVAVLTIPIFERTIRWVSTAPLRIVSGVGLRKSLYANRS